MTRVTHIRTFGLVALLVALAAGCGGGSGHNTLTSVSDCLREHGARDIRSEVPVDQDPDIDLLMDGYLGTVSGSFRRFRFTVFVTDTAAYASGGAVPLDPTAQSAIAPCVTAFDPGP